LGVIDGTVLVQANKKATQGIVNNKENFIAICSNTIAAPHGRELTKRVNEIAENKSFL
jgi:hypothetical protein